MSEEKASSPEEFRRWGRKVITLPASGLKVQIRRLTGEDFVPMGILPAGYMGMDEEEIEAAVEAAGKEDPSYDLKVQEIVVAAAVTSPLVFAGPIEETPEGYMHVSDFGPDLSFVYHEIIAFTQLTKEAAAEAASFSEEPMGGGPGQDGSEVGEEPSGAVAPAGP